MPTGFHRRGASTPQQLAPMRESASGALLPSANAYMQHANMQTCIQIISDAALVHLKLSFFEITDTKQ